MVKQNRETSVTVVIKSNFHAEFQYIISATPEEESEEKLIKEVYNFVINDTGRTINLAILPPMIIS